MFCFNFGFTLFIQGLDHSIASRIESAFLALVIFPPGSCEEWQQERGTDRQTDSHRPSAAALHTIVKLPFASSNPSKPRTNWWKFWKRCWELEEFKKKNGFSYFPTREPWRAAAGVGNGQTNRQPSSNGRSSTYNCKAACQRIKLPQFHRFLFEFWL